MTKKTAMKSERLDGADKARSEPVADVSLSELESHLGFHLRNAWVYMDQIFTKYMRESGFNAQHYAMLIVIENNAGCRISDLCRAIGVSPTNIVPGLDTLLNQGLVFRDFSSHDRRAKRLSLTDLGHKRLEDLRQMHQPVTDHFTVKLGQENMDKLIQLLSMVKAESEA